MLWWFFLGILDGDLGSCLDIIYDGLGINIDDYLRILYDGVHIDIDDYCYGEDILWLGVENNKPISKHAKYINGTNTKGQEAYRIPHVQSWSMLRFK